MIMRAKERGFNLMVKRKAAGLTQTQLGNAIGKEANTISSYERGERSPSLNTLTKIAQVFGCELRDLV